MNLPKDPNLFTVSVLGEFSSGKSTLINAIFLKDHILPTGSEVTTSVPTIITFGEGMELRFAKSGREEIITGAEQIKKAMAQTSGAVNSGVSSFNLSVNRPELKGLRIIDTPGFNAPNAVHSELTNEIINSKVSDLVLWVVDLHATATAPVLEVLARLKQANYRCILIGNHADKASDENEENRLMADLQKRACMFPEQFKAKASRGLEAAIKNDQARFEKSGMEAIFIRVMKGKDEWKIMSATQRSVDDKEKIKKEIVRLKEALSVKREEIAKFGSALEKYILTGAIPRLGERLQNQEVKKYLALLIERQVEIAANNSSIASPFAFLLEFKNEHFPYVHALLATHIAWCIKQYSNEISTFIEKEMQKISGIPAGFIRPSSLNHGPIIGPDAAGEALAEIMAGIMLAIGAVTAGISAFFIQTTVTYLLIFTASVWNPVGIAAMIIGGLLAAAGLWQGGSIKDKVTNMIKVQFGVPTGHGIFDQIWHGGTLPEAKELGMWSKIIMEGSSAGRKLKGEILNPPAIANIVRPMHIMSVLGPLNVPFDQQAELLKNILESMQGSASVHTTNRNSIPSLENDRLKDFNMLWHGKGDTDKNFTGINNELQKILNGLSTNIAQLEAQLTNL